MLESDQTKERKKGEKKGGKGKEYSRRDSKQKRIILLQRLGVVNDGILGSLTRCVHLGQDFLRESLGNLVDVDLAACCSDAFGLGFGESGDVAVHGVLFVGDEEVSCRALGEVEEGWLVGCGRDCGWLTKRMAILGAMVEVFVLCWYWYWVKEEVCQE